MFARLTPALLAIAAWPALAPAQDTLRLEPLIVRDAQINNEEAFRMLVPRGWEARGGIVWQHNLSNLASASMRIGDPNGHEALYFYQILPFVWTDGGIANFPTGSNYLGNLVVPPIDNGPDFVSRIIIANYRPELNELAELVESEPMPDLAAIVKEAIAEEGVNHEVRGERVRVVYADGPTVIEEDFYVVLSYATSDILPGTTFWQAQRLYSFRAERGKLDDQAALLQAMVSSVRINPHWFGQYLQVVSMFRANLQQSIRDAGALSRYIAQTNEEITEMHRQAYESAQASYDRINRQVSETIRGVETFDDPYSGRQLELPSHYNHAWVSQTGQVILSNEAGYDPNTDSTVNWQQMTPSE